MLWFDVPTLKRALTKAETDRSLHICDSRCLRPDDLYPTRTKISLFLEPAFVPQVVIGSQNSYLIASLIFSSKYIKNTLYFGIVSKYF